MNLGFSTKALVINFYSVKFVYQINEAEPIPYEPLNRD